MRLYLCAIPAAILAAALLAASGCGGGAEDDSAAGIIHRLLLAAGTQGSEALDSFPGRLPDGLPAQPPLYPGAEIIVSSRERTPVSAGDSGQEADVVAQPVLYFIVLDTADDADAVRTFYEQALEEDPWQLQSSFSMSQLDTLQFFNVEDIDIAGVVSIATGGDDDRTSILISMQDAGAFLDQQPQFELPPGRALPAAFPPDVPLFAGATITDTAFFREPGLESFLVIFLTTAAQDEVLEFYRDAFQQRGWTVQDTAAFGLEGRFDFRDELTDIQGDVFAAPFTRSDRYTEVRIQVQVNPAREPVDPDETPAATATPAGRTP
ncbi:MAG: hypothetical protein IIC90_04715 [Chloroflexi bacterium]|nr:hypothetical protein [Chloroflexota bacterium]